MKAIFLLFMVMLINVSHVCSQVKKTGRIVDLKKVLTSEGINKKMIVDKFQGEKKLKTESTTNSNVNVAPNQTTVVRTENNEIKKFDPSNYKKLQPVQMDTFSNKDINVIPELMIEQIPNSNEVIAYQIGFESKKPLEMNDSTDKFEGSIKFFLFSTSGNNVDKLNQPIPIEIVSDDLSTIQPNKEEIDHLSIPLTEIKLTGSNLSDSAKIKILTRSNPVGYETFIKIKPTIVIESGRSSMQGLGIQKIPLTVKIVGSSRNDSVLVNLQGKGNFSPNQLYVKYNMPSTVYLRSENIGNVTIQAESSQIKTGKLNLYYVFPWIFILCTIAGGSLGSIAKYLSDKSKSKKFFKNLATGIVIGLLASIIYYALGYSLNKFEVSDIFNEFAITGYSALVAFFGIKVIK
ncbi:MAG: hypothetical protein U0W24_15585 [Bacteroidales bacterium]